MSTAVESSRQAAPIPEYKQILGHPAPLWMLFMTEFWERFAFYGIRWALVLYVVAQFHHGDPAGEAPANRTYGSYLALVYAAAIFGGYIADRVLGYQRSILLGAVIMAIGLFLLTVPDQRIFEFALATIITGRARLIPASNSIAPMAMPNEISGRSQLCHGAERSIGLENHDRFHRFTPLRIGNADDRRFENRRVAIDDALDF